MRAGLLCLLALALAFPSAAARTLQYDLEARDDGFYLVGGDERNPNLSGENGDEVVLRLLNRATAAHNLHVGEPVSQATPCCLPPGEEAQLRFVVPAEASGGIAYWSDASPSAHRGLLLVGPALPRVRIVSPVEGADVNGSFEVRIVVENFVLEPFPAGSEPVAGRGHARYELDGRNVSTLTEREAFLFENLPVGHHFLRVELVGRDGLPLEPPAFDEVLVYRRAADPDLPEGNGTPTQDPTTPPTRTPGPGVLALALALAAGAAIASRSRRPPRGPGP